MYIDFLNTSLQSNRYSTYYIRRHKDDFSSVLVVFNFSVRILYLGPTC